MTTKTTTATAELASLTEAREKAHIIVHKLKRERDAWNAETEAMRAALTPRRDTHPEEHLKDGYTEKPGTETAKMVAEVKARMAAPNPTQPKLDEAIQKFHAAEIKERHFRILEMDRLIAEAAPPEDAEVFEAAWQAIAAQAAAYRAKEEAVRELFLDAPQIEGKDVKLDRRVEEWARLAQEALADPLTMPGLGDMAAWNVARLRERIEAGDE